MRQPPSASASERASPADAAVDRAAAATADVTRQQKPVALSGCAVAADARQSRLAEALGRLAVALGHQAARETFRAAAPDECVR